MCKSSSRIHCCLFQRGYVKGNSSTHFSHCLLTHQKTSAIWYEDYFPCWVMCQGKGSWPWRQVTEFFPVLHLTQCMPLGSHWPLRAAVSGDEICQLYRVSLNLSGLWDKNREPGVHVGSNWWEEGMTMGTQNVLELQTLTESGFMRCPWAFVQWPVVDSSTWIFPEKEGTAITSRLYILSAPCPHTSVLPLRDTHHSLLLFSPITCLLD